LASSNTTLYIIYIFTFSAGQSPNPFQRSFSSATYIYLRSSSHACGYERYDNYSWTYTGMHRESLHYNAWFYQSCANFVLLIIILDKELETLGRENPTK
jgi:hypothetical protein